MVITEKMLLDGWFAISNGMDCMSAIGNQTIYWTYRKGKDSEGFNPTVSSREEASEISLEDVRNGIIPLDREAENHHNIEKIRNAYSRIVGTEI